MVGTLICIGLIIGPIAHADDSLEINEKNLKEVAASKSWHALMHYEPNWMGRVRSLLDGQGFFFSPNGKYDPYSELEASLKAMGQALAVGKFKLHPQCAFPERFRYLRTTFKMNLKIEPCPKIEEYMRTFNDPQAVSVVFSSAYPNNPASMFGHTFLRIHSSRRTDLLDVGVNFAAFVPPDENGFAFVWFGTTGGYKGAWSTEPYYVKVNDYSNFESRDLWEYELNLTQDEVVRLLHHFWELETNSNFDYYFFDENCSYQILAAVTAIKPDWDILQHRIYVIPGETVKNIAYIPGVVRNVKFRPSAHNRVHNRYWALTDSEQEEFFALVKGEKPVQESRSRFVLDTVAAYFDYLRNEKKGAYKETYEKRREELLSHRATLGVATDAELARVRPADGTTQPDLGHEPYVWRIGGGVRGRNRSGKSFASLQLKSAYHDLLNNDQGFTRWSHIDFPWVEFQYSELDHNLWLEQLGGLAVSSFHPWTKIDRRPSWRFNSGIFTARDYGCDDCRHLTVEAAIGAAVSVDGHRSVVYGLAGAKLDFYSQLERGYRYGPQIEIGWLASFSERYKVRLSALGQWDVDQKSRPQYSTLTRLDHAYSLSKNRELRHSNLLQVPTEHNHLQWWESRLEYLIFFR